jgi:hypothetical protein
MGLELACLIAGFLALPFFPQAGLLAFLALFASLGLRLRAWAPAARKLKVEGVRSALAKVLVFDYLNKWHWIKGIFKGGKVGSSKCREARRRLKSMTPATYRNKI